MTTPNQRLADLGIILPTPTAPLAAYVPIVRSGNLLYVSGQLPFGQDGLVTGCLGKNIEVEVAQKAAELAAISILAQVVHGAKVELDQISRLVKLSIFVASTPDFIEHHVVANGASELLAKILGDKGKHARAAFGVAALPMGACVEIEAIIEVST